MQPQPGIAETTTTGPNVSQRGTATIGFCMATALMAENATSRITMTIKDMERANGDKVQKDDEAEKKDATVDHAATTAAVTGEDEAEALTAPKAPKAATIARKAKGKQKAKTSEGGNPRQAYQTDPYADFSL